MPSISRFIKSIIAGAIALVLVYIAMSSLVNMSYSFELADYVPTSDTGFALAVWSWASVSGWTGVTLGLMHADRSEPDAFSAFSGAVKMLAVLWAAFFAVNLALLVFARPFGAIYFIATSFAVLCALVALTRVLGSSPTRAAVLTPSPA